MNENQKVCNYGVIQGQRQSFFCDDPDLDSGIKLGHNSKYFTYVETTGWIFI